MKKKRSGHWETLAHSQYNSINDLCLQTVSGQNLLYVLIFFLKCGRVWQNAEVARFRLFYGQNLMRVQQYSMSTFVTRSHEIVSKFKSHHDIKTEMSPMSPISKIKEKMKFRCCVEFPISSKLILIYMLWTDCRWDYNILGWRHELSNRILTVLDVYYSPLQSGIV